VVYKLLYIKEAQTNVMRLGDLPNTALLLVFVAVIFVAGFLVLSGLDDDLTANSYAGFAFGRGKGYF